MTGPLSEEAREVLVIVDGVSDVATHGPQAPRTQFDTAKLLHGLTKLGLVQPVPPDKHRVMELFRYTVEAIYIKLVMYGYSRKGYGVRVRAESLRPREQAEGAHAHRQDPPDRPGPQLDATALLDLYKLFIAIENNKFAKLFPPEIHKGLTEALYQHMDKETAPSCACTSSTQWRVC